MNLRRVFALLLPSVLVLFSVNQGLAQNSNEPFSIIVIPDTQNAVDFTHQRAEGFAIDSVDIFLAQMEEISRRDNVAFVASVGDVWQHVLADNDPEHTRRGVGPAENVTGGFGGMINAEQTRNFEIPKSIEGYTFLHTAGIPFGVAPGNHDYDAWWLVEVEASDEAASPNVHVGGLSAFRSAFGSDTDFFRDKPWYVSGFEGGGSSAQIFPAGAYQFLHFAFEMQAGNDVLAWAQQVIDDNPGLPTFISTHDYLSREGERKPSMGMNLAYADPEGNNHAEKIWQEFIRKNDQIFMVLSGHQPGQALAIDVNDSGNNVYQVLADYQLRGQAGLDAGQPLNSNGGIAGIGDGWYRDMVFHLYDDNPRIEVITRSSHYKTTSGALSTYAQWYKDMERPSATDAEFADLDEYVIPLDGFYSRFGQ